MDDKPPYEWLRKVYELEDLIGGDQTKIAYIIRKFTRKQSNGIPSGYRNP